MMILFPIYFWPKTCLIFLGILVQYHVGVEIIILADDPWKELWLLLARSSLSSAEAALLSEDPWPLLRQLAGTWMGAALLAHLVETLLSGLQRFVWDILRAICHWLCSKTLVGARAVLMGLWHVISFFPRRVYFFFFRQRPRRQPHSSNEIVPPRIVQQEELDYWNSEEEEEDEDWTEQDNISEEESSDVDVDEYMKEFEDEGDAFFDEEEDRQILTTMTNTFVRRSIRLQRNEGN
jgi:hypothetical protein